MSMFTLQTLGLILLFGLIGLLIGWLIRSFFCKPDISGGKANLSGTAKGGSTATTGASNASLKATGETASADASSGTLNKTATAAAGIAAVAATTRDPEL